MYGAISENGAGEKVLTKVPLKVVHSRKQTNKQKTGSECVAVKEMKAHKHFIQ